MMRIQLPRAMAHVNRFVTNPIMGLWAPYLPPWAVIVHQGRRSGRIYRTVIWAFVRKDAVVIALTYGPTDWQRNVVAAGTGQIVRLGRTRTLVAPTVVDASDARALPVGTRWTARVFGSAFVARLSRGQ